MISEFSFNGKAGSKARSRWVCLLRLPRERAYGGLGTMLSLKLRKVN